MQKNPFKRQSVVQRKLKDKISSFCPAFLFRDLEGKQDNDEPFNYFLGEGYRLMTEEQKNQITRMREEGRGYVAIARTLCISENTVKSFCRRKKLNGVAVPRAAQTTTYDGRHFCDCCGKEVAQVSGRKEKRFCSDRCRNKWWNSHLDRVNRKANYEFVCPQCKKTFMAYGNAKRKYCSHECYIAHRFGGGADD